MHQGDLNADRTFLTPTLGQFDRSYEIPKSKLHVIMCLLPEHRYNEMKPSLTLLSFGYN
jgi:hypothetical protein